MIKLVAWTFYCIFFVVVGRNPSIILTCENEENPKPNKSNNPNYHQQLEDLSVAMTIELPKGQGTRMILLMAEIRLTKPVEVGS